MTIDELRPPNVTPRRRPVHQRIGQSLRADSSEDYKRVIEQTPHIVYKTSVIVWIFLIFLILLIALISIGIFAALVTA